MELKIKTQISDDLSDFQKAIELVSFAEKWGANPVRVYIDSGVRFKLTDSECKKLAYMSDHYYNFFREMFD